MAPRPTFAFAWKGTYRIVVMLLSITTATLAENFPPSAPLIVMTVAWFVLAVLTVCLLALIRNLWTDSIGPKQVRVKIRVRLPVARPQQFFLAPAAPIETVQAGRFLLPGSPVAWKILAIPHALRRSAGHPELAIPLDLLLLSGFLEHPGGPT